MIAPISKTYICTSLLVCLQALIAAGGLVTLVTRRKQVTSVAVEDEVRQLGVGRGFGAALVLLWGGLLVASIVARSNTSYSDFKLLHWWERTALLGVLALQPGSAAGQAAGGSLIVAHLLQNQLQRCSGFLTVERT